MASTAGSKRQRDDANEGPSQSVVLMGGTPQLPAIVRQWQQSKLCDAQLFVEGEEMTAHRSVLAAASDYFNSLFCGAGESMSDGTGPHTLGGVSARQCYLGLATRDSNLGWFLCAPFRRPRGA